MSLKFILNWTLVLFYHLMIRYISQMKLISRIKSLNRFPSKVYLNTVVLNYILTGENEL
jgi:hypothetical protein